MARKRWARDAASWNTNCEMKFLKDVGRQIHSSVTMSREQLLRNYRKAIKNRRWDEKVEVEKIEQYLDGEGV